MILRAFREQLPQERIFLSSGAKERHCIEDVFFNGSERPRLWLHQWIVRWLKRLFVRASHPTPPILLRVAEPDGSAPALLDVEMRWLPTERVMERSVRTADGLCVLHWRAHDNAVEITVRSAHGAGSIVLHRASSDGAVEAVQLHRQAPQPSSERLESAVSAG